MDPNGRVAVHPVGPLSSTSQRSAIRRIDSSELLGQGQQLIIDHNGQNYRLRITSNGKLLLTK